MFRKKASLTRIGFLVFFPMFIMSSCLLPAEKNQRPAGTASGLWLYPSALVLSTDKRNLYVAEYHARRLDIVEIASGAITRSISLPGEPNGLALAPDGKKTLLWKRI
jgi:sugar lactone lactonase YvrE